MLRDGHAESGVGSIEKVYMKIHGGLDFDIEEKMLRFECI
jgi:hypothetical protein